MMDLKSPSSTFFAMFHSAFKQDSDRGDRGDPGDPGDRGDRGDPGDPGDRGDPGGVTSHSGSVICTAGEVGGAGRVSLVFRAVNSNSDCVD